MHHIDVFTFYVSVLLHIHNSNLASQPSRPMCSTWWCVRGSSGSMWTRGKIWLQTSLFISHRYSIKHTLQTQNCHDTRLTLCLHTGAAQVPAGLPQLYQRRHDQPGRAALQSSSWFRQVAVCHDPQNAEGAGSRWPDEKHVTWRLEEGKGRQRQDRHWWHVYSS